MRMFFLAAMVFTPGLRYFNVFGRDRLQLGHMRSDSQMDCCTIAGTPFLLTVMVNKSRLCYVANAIQANLLAATTLNKNAANQVYNVAVGDRTTLNELFEYLRLGLVDHFGHLQEFAPVYQDFRAGDVRHSLADIGKAHALLICSNPSHSRWVAWTLDWYVAGQQYSK
jgi:UDP-N-acetylglucosamine 4-epimerase